jgi:thiol-disulfide isomerase/thioredoxin
MTKLFSFIIIMFLFGCSSKFPEFQYKTLDGELISQENLKGKATVLCVWATWCGDCIREIPELNELAEKYKDNDDVLLLAFSDEDEATVRKSLARYPFNFIHIVDSKEFSDKLKSGVVKHFPQVMVLDKDLTQVFEVTENKEPIFNTLDNHIQEIIKK